VTTERLIERLLRGVLPETAYGRVRRLARRFSTWNDGHGHVYGLDRAIGWHENRRPSRMGQGGLGWAVDGQMPDLSFVVGTSEQGVLLWSAGSLTQLVACRGAYGITRDHDGIWYAFHKTGLQGRIVRFRIKDARVSEVGTVVWGLSRGVHQVDLVGGALLVADTYHNSIVEYRQPGTLRNRFWTSFDRRSFPSGELTQARASTNYGHFNSLFASGGRIHVLAHNETMKTGRGSELYVLSDNLQVLERRPVGGSNCHNYYVDDRYELVCRSVEGTVADHGVDVFRPGTFTRGLSVASDYLLIGGSDVEPDRERREQTDGYVYVTDPAFNLVATLTIHRAQVQEIRRVDRPDFGLSDERRT